VTQVDSEAMADLQHALIDLINGGPRGSGKGRSAGHDDDPILGAAE
jgi:hypothetical protein